MTHINPFPSSPTALPRRAVCTAVSLITLLVFALPASAQPGLRPPGLRGKMGRPPFLRELFMPETVMKYQSDIGLTEDQRTKITEVIKATQGEVLDSQWKLEEEQQKLAKLLGAERIDATAALAQADVVMASEQKLKKEHLNMLIQIKNVLTADQQKMLREKSRPKRGPRPPRDDD